ncbi:lysine transporter LysE [Aureimonas altamirensis]|uniref:Lysine transporter LysE n=1 Tax=Aureimonas altamirensis TaxID=370622 RepID=A0A0B1Q2X1_9HYPH|nr:LysE family translocator [Aureimonas altamirensis]KHJ54749.1 lysine transporter LysE [Aureimonas altamirensis]
MDMGMLMAFWVVSFALVMTPGADWAYAISAGMQERAIAPAIVGMLLGYLAITLVVAAGVGALVASEPAVLTALTFVGAGYLLWLGVGVLMDPPGPQDGNDSEGTTMAWVVRGFGISGLNPKALLLFLALLPQFTSRAASWSMAGQITAMGLVQIVNCGVVYALVGIGARAVLRTRPKTARVVGRLSGTAMIVIAVILLAEQVAPMVGA